MTSSIQRLTVVREPRIDPETAIVRYRKQDDGWYVQTPKDAEFQEFAHPDANERDVRQLIAKKWDARYGDPDSFGESGYQTTFGEGSQ